MWVPAGAGPTVPVRGEAAPFGGAVVREEVLGAPGSCAGDGGGGAFVFCM